MENTIKATEAARTVYYEDPLKDEFSGYAPKNYFIGSDYHYIHKNLFYRVGSSLVYRVVMTPMALFHSVFSLHQKFVNRSALKACRKQGYYVYGNHTQHMGGGYTPSLCFFPKKVYIVVNPDNLAVKGLKTVFEMSGALPLPSELSGMPSFFDAVGERIKEKHVVCIYPEAHIWPFCTFIRPFKAASFHYPSKTLTPVYAFTDCYKRRKHSSKPRIVTYIDGPFYPNPALPLSERALQLRNEVYSAMSKRASEESDYEVIHYVQKGEKLHD